MKRIAFWIAWAGVFGLHWSLAAAPVSAPREPEAVITSESLELLDGGARTVFVGRVKLVRGRDTVESDRMVRTRATGVVDARGRVRGTWFSEEHPGEKIIVTGRQARFTPATDTVEVWENARATRWETERDTMPVVIDAQRFIGYRGQQVVWAKKDVWIRQADRADVRCQEAKLDRNEQKLYLWGLPRMDLHLKDGRGRADFKADTGWVLFDPRRTHLEGRVRGHVIPAAEPGPR